MHHRPISCPISSPPRRAVLHAALAVPLALSLAGQAAAQSAATAFPSKTIRFVVPYPPGGPTDLMARMLQPELQSRLGVPVVVDNKGGAGGNTGSAEVAKQAPADGHTLLLAASGPMAVNPSLYASMPFNPLTDLAPVIQLSAFPLVLEVPPSLGVQALAEFLALATAGTPVLSFASAGNGTPQHLAGELFNTMAGVKMGHIPYRGAGPALNDLIGGQVNVMFDIVGSSLPHIQAGKLIPLAVTSGERAKVLVFSVTEGEDKPLKYPDMFQAAGLILLHKCDLLPHLRFDVARALDFVRQVNPDAPVIQLSSTTGEGFDAWMRWIDTQCAAA